MEEKTVRRLARSGKVLDVIGKVLAGFCIAVAVLSLLCALLAAMVPEDIIRNVIDMLNISIRSDLLILDTGITLGSLLSTATAFSLRFFVIIPALSLCAYSVVSAIILFILSAIFKATAVNKTPFMPENVKRLRIIGIVLIIISIFFGLTNLIFAFCVFALAFVFQYGVELQKQADETL
jgi:hypothetical protein